MGSNISPDGHTQAVLDAIRRIVQVLRESSRAAEQLVGLSGAQLFVLQTLADAPAVSLNDLAERTHTHQSSVSTVVSRLVERGFVRRTPFVDDARVVRLSITSSGQKLIERAPDAVQGRLIGAIEKLPPEQRGLLATVLGELTKALSTSDEAPAMFFEEHAPRRSRKPS